MKKQHITLLLLIWLFCQPLFAATSMASGVAGVDSDCGFHDKSHCAVDMESHSQHVMPCDHCATACQSLLIMDKLLPLVEAGHPLFRSALINSIADTFLATLYRPPILA